MIYLAFDNYQRCPTPLNGKPFLFFCIVLYLFMRKYFRKSRPYLVWPRPIPPLTTAGFIKTEQVHQYVGSTPGLDTLARQIRTMYHYASHHLLV